MAANTTCSTGEVVFPHDGFRAVAYDTKLQRRHLHRLKHRDPEVIGIVPKGISLPVAAANARFRFVPYNTVDRTSGIAELVKVEGEYKPMAAAASFPTLQAAMSDDIDALPLALNLACLGKIAFADDVRVSRNSGLAGNTVDKGTKDLASVRSPLRSAA